MGNSSLTWVGFGSSGSFLLLTGFFFSIFLTVVAAMDDEGLKGRVAEAAVCLRAGLLAEAKAVVGSGWYLLSLVKSDDIDGL